MDWSQLAGPVIKIGGTAIGSALGMPTIGAAAGQILASALGVDPTPEAVSAEIARGGPAVAAAVSEADRLAAAKWDYLKAGVQADATQGHAINETMRAEIASGLSWWHWRHLMGYVVIIWAMVIIGLVALLVVKGDGASLNLFITLLGAIVTYFVSLCGLLGLVGYDTTRLRVAAATGQSQPTILNTIVAGVTKAVKR